MQQAQHVLIVDDDPIAQSIYKSFFASVGAYRVHGAFTGKHGVQLLKAEAASVDLIVLDLNMPEMDGIEFLKHLHQMNYSGRLIIGSASHRANINSATKLAVLYGLDLLGVITKPLTKSNLENVFRCAPQNEHAQLAS